MWFFLRDLPRLLIFPNLDVHSGEQTVVIMVLVPAIYGYRILISDYFSKTDNPPFRNFNVELRHQFFNHIITFSMDVHGCIRVQRRFLEVYDHQFPAVLKNGLGDISCRGHPEAGAHAQTQICSRSVIEGVI